MITSKTKNSISVFIFYSIPLDTIFWKLSTVFTFLFSTISCSSKQKSSQVSLRANKKTLKLTLESNFFSGGVGGIRTHARGKPSNDLAKMPKLQFVVLILNLPLYIVFIHCEILLKTFWLHHKYMEQRGTIIGTTETKGTLYLVFVISTNLPNCTPP